MRTPGTNRVKNKRIFDPIVLNDNSIDTVTDAKIRGPNVFNNLEWNDHIDVVMNIARNVCTAYLYPNARAW